MRSGAVLCSFARPLWSRSTTFSLDFLSLHSGVSRSPQPTGPEGFTGPFAWLKGVCAGALKQRAAIARGGLAIAIARLRL
jgi:hypothetical protein